VAAAAQDEYEGEDEKWSMAAAMQAVRKEAH